MNEKPFGKWRQRLWPIHSFELKKVIPLILMKFFVSVNYGIFASLKDTFIVTGKGSGAEVIPVLKGWIVLPIAFIVTVIYAKLSNLFKRSTLFYSILLFFVAFILIYALYLYPNSEILSPHASADALTNLLGKQYSHWIAIYRNWMQTIFFVVAELWGSLAIFLLFWGFSNQINELGEAKRYYNLFIVAGDIAPIIAGPLARFYAIKYAHTEFAYTLQSLTGYIVIFTFIIMLLHWWMHRYVLCNVQLYNPKDSSYRDQKTKLNLLQGIKFIASSKYLRYLAIMVVSYGLAISLIEISWKASLKLQYPNPADYQAFYGNVTTAIGITSLLAAFFFGGSVIRLFGWCFSALIAPVVVGITGLLFLMLYLFQDFITPITLLFGLTPLTMLIFLGAFQNVASKVVKYSFFDTTKEMAFIPLDYESKVKGKAAIDVIGSRFGKSGSAWIQLGFMHIIGTGSVLSITNYLIPFVAFTVFYWIYSVKKLNVMFQKKLEVQENLESAT